MWGQDILIKMKTIKEKEWGKEEKWRKNAQKKEEMKTTFLSCKLKCACENKVKYAAKSLKMCGVCSKVFCSTCSKAPCKVKGKKQSWQVVCLQHLHQALVHIKRRLLHEVLDFDSESDDSDHLRLFLIVIPSFRHYLSVSQYS